MKFYYYLIISVGLMLTMALAGISGVGTNIKTLMIDENDTIIQPDTQYNGSVSDVPEDVFDDITSSSTNYWTKVLIALIAIGLLGSITGVQIFGSGVSFNGQVLVRSAVGYGSFALFAADMWSLVTLVFSYSNPWVSWFIGVLVTVYVIGFLLACLEFVGGTD